MSINISPADWPQKEDYDMAMEVLHEKIHDPVIKKGKVNRDNTGILRPGGANLYVRLYHIDDWMVRCFCQDGKRKPPHDILARYQHISTFTKSMQHIPALIPITYVPDAIEVDYYDRGYNSYTLITTKLLPFVRMPFIFSSPLGSFIAAHFNNRLRMEQLCEAWLQMIYSLKSIHMAHGDLDLTNVLVTEQNSKLTLKLIDYDNAWIPSLNTGYEQTEIGHPHFQHPAFQSRSKRPYDEHMDNFSALVIYISLKVLTLYTQLYTDKDWGADDTHRLLLSSEDYEAEMQYSTSNHITWLRSAKIPSLQPLLEELSDSLHMKRMPRHLSELLPEDYKKRIKEIETVPPGVIKPNDPAPVTDNGEYTFIYNDWGKAEHKKEARHAPTSPNNQATTVPSSPQSAALNQLQLVPPDGRDAQTKHDPVPARQVRVQRQKSISRFIIPAVAIIALIILVIVLWLAHALPLHSHSNIEFHLMPLIALKHILTSLWYKDVILIARNYLYCIVY